jgi:limonene-1,2-epoxide hydrolase
MFAIQFALDGGRTVGLVLLLLVVPMTAPGCGADPNAADPPAEVVRAFLQSLDQHDVERALARLDDAFVFRSSDGAFEAGKQAMPSMLAGDAAAGSKGEIRELTSSGATVQVLLVERNRFTELLELEPWVVEATFVVRDGRIVEEAAREIADDLPPFEERFRRALEPVRRWAVEARPDEAKAVFGDGGVARYDGPTARRLLALIEAHHRTSGEDR